MSERNEKIKIKNIFSTLYPKLVDDIEGKILSPLSCIT